MQQISFNGPNLSKFPSVIFIAAPSWACILRLYAVSLRGAYIPTKSACAHYGFCLYLSRLPRCTINKMIICHMWCWQLFCSGPIYFLKIGGISQPYWLIHRSDWQGVLRSITDHQRSRLGTSPASIPYVGSIEPPTKIGEQCCAIFNLPKILSHRTKLILEDQSQFMRFIHHASTYKSSIYKFSRTPSIFRIRKCSYCSENQTAKQKTRV